MSTTLLPVAEAFRRCHTQDHDGSQPCRGHITSLFAATIAVFVLSSSTAQASESTVSIRAYPFSALGPEVIAFVPSPGLGLGVTIADYGELYADFLTAFTAHHDNQSIYRIGAGVGKTLGPKRPESGRGLRVRVALTVGYLAFAEEVSEDDLVEIEGLSVAAPITLQWWVGQRAAIEVRLRPALTWALAADQGEVDSGPFAGFSVSLGYLFAL
jgi:hypothetical protein